MEMPGEIVEIDVFKDAIMEDNIAIQVDSIKRLPALAAAIEAVRTREELLPFVSNCIESLPKECCFNLAEQLERLVPFVGGSSHVSLILDILVKLACEEENLIRERAIEGMKNICASLTSEQCTEAFFLLIENLVGASWFTMKCSAGSLITIVYSKMPAEKQTELRHHFRNLIQDDFPMVRRSTAINLKDLIPLMSEEHIISEFVPVFDNLAQDEQDSVRVLAVDVGVSISQKLKDFETYEYLLKTFKILSVDDSWKVRQRLACKIHEVKITEKIREEILKIYRGCIRDEQSEVRVFAAGNLYNFVANLAGSYSEEAVFEKVFEEVITSEIHFMITDISDDVRVALSTNILSLSGILSNDSFKTNILPLVIDALENEEFMPFKENMLKNLSHLPINVDITKSLKSIKTVIQNLLENSQMHWRTRRNLLLAFTHITRSTTKEFFDENLKIFYAYLLHDPIFAIRRTAPIILPILMQQFGFEWGAESLIPIFLRFGQDHRYLFRHILCFGIDELITPSLQDHQEKYLQDFQSLVAFPKSLELLSKIIYLTKKLQGLIPNDSPEEFSLNDSLNFYAEDTVVNLRKEQKVSVFKIAEKDTTCYVQEVLILLVRDLVPILQDLCEDPIQNVQERAKMTLRNVKNFGRRLGTESEETWIAEALKEIPQESSNRIEEELEETLKKPIQIDDGDDEDLDSTMPDDSIESLPEEQQEPVEQPEEEPVAAECA